VAADITDLNNELNSFLNSSVVGTFSASWGGNEGVARYVSLSGDTMTGGLSSPSISADELYIKSSTIYFFNSANQIVENLTSDDITNFKSSYTTTNASSSNWDSNYTTVNTNSANWNYQGTDIKALTSNWDSNYTTVNTNSANWANHVDLSLVSSASANWDSNYTTVSTNSANWNSVYTMVNSNSADYDSNYTTVNANSANWSSHTDISLVATTSANWNSNYTTVNTYSANWNYQGTDIKTLSSNWQNTYTTVNSNSADWSRVWATVEALDEKADTELSNLLSVSTARSNLGLAAGATMGIASQAQAIDGTLNTVIMTPIRTAQAITSSVGSLSSNWQNTYTTVQDNSATWIAQTLTYNETEAELTISNGNTISLSALNTNSVGVYLPLSGGTLTGDLDIHANITSVSSIQFDTTYLPDAGVTPGKIAWNSDESTLDLGLNADVTLQLGQETVIYVKNTSGEIIRNGWAVYASGASGTGSGHITISAYQANYGGVNDLYLIGVATQEISDNSFGFVTTIGKVRDVVKTEVQESTDLSSWSIGTILYVSTTERGKFTSVVPSAPNEILPIAMIIGQNGTHRTFFVRSNHGYKLTELHDVKIISPQNGDLLSWDYTNNYWYNTTAYQGTDIKSLTANWDSTYTTVYSNSADWNYQGTDIKALTSNWNSVYTMVNSNSAAYESNYTTVNANSANWSSHTDISLVTTTSANWNSNYTTVNTNSANWNSNYTTVNANSATTWNYQGTDVKSLTANWQNTYTTVNSNSAQWAIDTSIDTQVRSLTSNWENTYTSFSTQSADNASVYSTVQSTSANVGKSVIGITLDGAGSAITTGYKGFIQVPYDATIISATLLGDTSGTLVLDIWKDTYANYPPTDADSITGGNEPHLTSTDKYTDSTLTGWTTTINAGDVIAFNVDAASTVTKATLTLEVRK
jgi:hypothetical protein